MSELGPWIRRRRGRALRWSGIGAVSTAAGSVVLFPPSLWTILLATAAWIALAMDRRLGPLPAALAVLFALPYDRAADIDQLRVAGIPLRPQDVVIVLAVLVSLPALRRIRWSMAPLLVAGFGFVGIAALVFGLLNDHAIRDIVRDARWWGLYAAGILLIGQPSARARVLRGTFLGLAVYAGLLIGTALLPAVEGGLKLRAMAFDLGVLRLQFGPTPFLLLPITYFAARLSRATRRRSDAASLVVFTVALTLSLTRVTILVAVAVVALVAIVALLGRGARRRSRLIGASLVIGVSAVGLTTGIATNALGVWTAELTRPGATAPDRVGDSAASPLAPTPTRTPEPTTTSMPSPVGAPVSPATLPPRPTPTFEPRGPGDRAIFDLDVLPFALGARFEGYERAVAVIAESPWIGHGLGTLVEVDYEFGAGRFDTPGMLPNVDNAYLTVAMKAGIVGVVAFMAMIAWPLVRVIRDGRHQLQRFWIPAWLGLLALTLTQSFAVIGHSPFALGLLIVAAEGMRRRRTR